MSYSTFVCACTIRRGRGACRSVPAPCAVGAGGCRTSLMRLESLTRECEPECMLDETVYPPLNRMLDETVCAWWHAHDYRDNERCPFRTFTCVNRREPT